METTRPDNATTRWVGFGLYVTAVLIAFFAPLRELALLSTRSELHSHTVLIPLISIAFLAAGRRRVFSEVDYSFLPGSLVIAAGSIAYASIRLQGDGLGPNDQLSAMIFSFWLVLVGGFLLFFGLRALRAGIFPLVFLVLMTPLPTALVDRIVKVLLWGSAAFTQLFFQALGVTFLREGSLFHLGRVSIEIAPECSGIRSSLGLFIAVTVVARLALRRWWNRALVLLLIVPLVMIKNAIRIVTLTLLAEYVDVRFLTKSWLHQSGGFIFAGIAMLLFLGILMLIRAGEARTAR
jgi:exosortase